MQPVKIVSTDGTQIAAWRSGDGPPLVLVHGTGSSHTTFRLVTPLLDSHVTVYAMDRRGRGGSGDAETYAIAREFEDVAAVVESIGGPVNLLGHSFGALCAAEAALETSNIRTLVLYEGGPKPPIALVSPDVIQRMEASLRNCDREGVLVTFLAEGIKMPPAEIDFMRSQPVWAERLGDCHTLPRELTALNAYGSVFARFKNLDIPTLLILGGDSPASRHQAAAAWNQLLPRSEVVVLPGQQHVATATAPELFASEVIRFLEST